MTAPTANGSHPADEAIAAAEAAALAQQDANPPVHTPPPPAPQPEAPKEPALHSPEWYAAQISALEAEAQQRYAQWQQALGGLNVVRQMQAMTAAQQAGQKEN